MLQVSFATCYCHVLIMCESVLPRLHVGLIIYIIISLVLSYYLKHQYAHSMFDPICCQ